MDAVTPKGSETSDTHSHLVRPENMEWQKTRFPGCEAKTLLFDRTTGLMTALMRFGPGAVLPDHEHVNIEQTYVLEGHLVDQPATPQALPQRQGLPLHRIGDPRNDRIDDEAIRHCRRNPWAGTRGVRISQIACQAGHRVHSHSHG